MRIRWLPLALANLDDEAAYIAEDNPVAAADVVSRLQLAVERLAYFPLLGRVGRISGTRELIVPGTPYIVAYRVRDEAVEILRVLHTARKWPTRL